MACLGDCVDRSCGRLCLGHMVSCQGSHNPERRNGSSGSTSGVGRFAKTNRARSGDHSPWKCTAIHLLTDLCTHKWVSEEVVLRHWSPRQARTTACCDRSSRSRSAVGAITQQPQYRKSEPRACRDHKESLPGATERQCCFAARRG